MCDVFDGVAKGGEQYRDNDIRLPKRLGPPKRLDHSSCQSGRDEAKNEFYGRPTYVLQLTDGSLLVSDEQNGAIYRITYAAPQGGRN